VKRLAWVIGEGGMLGSHLVNVLPAQGFEVFSPHLKFNWDDKNQVIFQIKNVFDVFSREIIGYKGWMIFWAAGNSNMLTKDSDVAKENEIFDSLIQCLEEQKHISMKGIFAVASSAGAIYADSQLSIVSENSPVCPNTSYALGKLQQEKLIINLSTQNPLISAAIFRISTLYGIRANNFNSQGLINAMARKILNHQDIEFFVPLNTFRDFIHVEDASLLIAKILNEAFENPKTFIKIVSSGETHSIDEIIEIFRKKIKHPFSYKCKLNEFSNIYNKRVNFQSTLPGGVEYSRIRGLEEGIGDLLMQLNYP
jgi:UDP-glucose 4-epimerase